MDKRITWRTNALICAIIVIGFAITSYLGYHSNREAFERDAERMATFASEGVSHELDTQFTRPIDVALTMAHDTMLASFLEQEEARVDDPAFVTTLSAYLNAYRQKFNFDSVFLISPETKRYYHFSGINRLINPNNAEDSWYNEFLAGTEDYSLNLDADKAANNAATIFANARIRDDQGNTRGIVGVGFKFDNMSSLLGEYEARTDSAVYLINSTGSIEAATNDKALGVNLFAMDDHPLLEERILSSRTDTQDFWYKTDEGNGFIVAHYLPDLDWFLLVNHDASDLQAQASRQFAATVAIMAVVILLVLAATTTIFRRYNNLIVQQMLLTEQKRKSVFQKATEQLYENIYEIDITNNVAANEVTAHYFESVGAAKDTPYDEALTIAANKQVEAPYRQGYIDTFNPRAVLAAFRSGNDNLSYDFKMTTDGENYYWVRIRAHLFLWEEDDALHMLAYRQNIDKEKQRERYLFEQMQHDSLTHLYNKAATQEHIERTLANSPETTYAFFILDADEFKSVNDQRGHGAGDIVLAEFARVIRQQFRPDDIVGRIGGDEFVAFMAVPDAATADNKARDLVDALKIDVEADGEVCCLSASIGIALSPKAGTSFEALYRHADIALYQAKECGKNCYKRYEL